MLNRQAASRWILIKPLFHLGNTELIRFTWSFIGLTYDCPIRRIHYSQTILLGKEAGDNRLMTPKSFSLMESFGTSMLTHHILGLKKVPRQEFQLFVNISVYIELGLERCDTVRFLSLSTAALVLKGKLRGRLNWLVWAFYPYHIMSL